MERVLIFKKNSCQPCINLGIELESKEVSFEYETYNIEDVENLEICEKFRIRKVPTAIIVNEQGEKVKQLNGNIDGALNLDLIEKTFNNIQAKK